MRTRHLVGLISGVLILSVLLPVGLSIWLAHQQVETSFIEELDTYSSRVAIRANKVATQGKDALQELERWQGAACSEAHLMEMRRVSYSYRYIQEVVYIAKWHLNRSQFGIRIDHDLASISDHSLASQSITIWHASDH